MSGCWNFLLPPGRSAPDPVSSQGSWGHVTAGQPPRCPHLDLGCRVQAGSRDDRSPSWRKRQEHAASGAVGQQHPQQTVWEAPALAGPRLASACSPRLVLPPSCRRRGPPCTLSTTRFLISSARVGWRPGPGWYAGHSSYRSLRTRHGPRCAGALPAVTFHTPGFPAPPPPPRTAKLGAGSPSGLQSPTEHHCVPASGSWGPGARAHSCGATTPDSLGAHLTWSSEEPDLGLECTLRMDTRRAARGAGREWPEPSRVAGEGRRLPRGTWGHGMHRA